MRSKQPYIGLRPFERTETDIFFGRETHTDELIDRLGSSHFLAVVGTSGCGKSSLVKTGLIAGLEAGYLAKASTHWRIIEMRPSNQPFHALAAQLFSELNDVLAAHYTVDSLRDTLKQGSLSLHELLAQHPLPNNAQLLIVCDQFEEIFRFFQQGASAEASNFVSLLLASSKPYPVSTTKLSDSVYVIITMRSDFLGDCAQFAGLAEAINQGLYLTPRLNAQQLRAAIEEPASVFYGDIEPALITQLLEDAQTNQDQLPLLQHVLMRLWDLASDKTATLTLADYQAIGGLSDALSRHADEVYNQLSNEQQRIAELLFRSLTERGDAQRDTRRPTKLSEIIELTDTTITEVVTVINAFRQVGRCFLTLHINKTLIDNSIIDISHESLIRQWKTLQEWTKDEVESAKKYQQLKDRASAWEDENANLLQSPELESYQNWWNEKKLTKQWANRYGNDFELTEKFLEKSHTEQQKQQDEKQKLQIKKQKQQKQQIVGLVIFSIIVSGLATFSFLQYQKAEQQTKRIEQQKKLTLKVISQFSELPEALASIPKTEPLTAEILKYSIQYLEDGYESNSNNKSLQRNLLDKVEKLADIYAQLGNTNNALIYYQQALTISKKLAEQDPNNSQAQQDLFVSLNRLASVYIQLDAEAKKKALDLYQQALTISKKLAAQDPNNIQVQRNLFVSLNQLANVYTQLDNISKVLDIYQQALEISKKLVELDPNNKQYLSESFGKLASYWYKQKNYSEAANFFDQALKIIPDNLNILFDDLKLALVQDDIIRFQQRLKTLSPLLNSQNKYYIAIPFLSYLANPQQGYQAIIETIEKSDKNVGMDWNFSDLQPVIQRQQQNTQIIVHFFISFFEKRLTLDALKTNLAELEKNNNQFLQQ